MHKENHAADEGKNMDSQPTIVEHRRKIAIIGAGMSGLCALRHFAHDPKYMVVVFERTEKIAGIWNYPDQAENYSDDVEHSSPYYCRIYRDLRTNSPRDITGFQDFPFPKGTDSYCRHETVLRYFHDYVEHFNLSAFIKIRHQVNLLKPAARNVSGQVIKWELEVLNLESRTTKTLEFDNVIICNGHYHKPYIPTLNGIQNFKGPIIHSSLYRIPETFRHKTVLIVGGRASANDLTCEISPHAKRVILHRRFEKYVFRDKFANVMETTELTGFGSHYCIFRDGSTADIDFVLLCTGFVYDMPFLSDDCHVRITRGRVSPLYRHLIHCENPSMAFIGLVSNGAVGHIANLQVCYYKAYLDGTLQLPSTEMMLAEEERESQERLEKGLPDHTFHSMLASQWPFMELLAKEAGLPMYEPSSKALSDANSVNILSMPYAFRNFRMEKVNSENFICMPANELTETST